MEYLGIEDKLLVVKAGRHDWIEEKGEDLLAREIDLPYNLVIDVNNPVVWYREVLPEFSEFEVSREFHVLLRVSDASPLLIKIGEDCNESQLFHIDNKDYFYIGMVEISNAMEVIDVKSRD